MSPYLLSSDMMVASGLEEKDAHEALHPPCTVPTLQASGESVLIWG
ncbi:hypothetical protein AVEN_34474-1, partial [Araneus ventricosus]